MTPLFYPIRENFKKAQTLGLPMDLRLFLFLVVLVLTMVIGVISILLVSGTFTAGLSQSEKLIQNDLIYLSDSINEEFGFLSQHTIELSKSLSAGIENKLVSSKKDILSIRDDPKLLVEILSTLGYERALSGLLRSKCSGVFIILDATINPALASAENSKAGLYIKNMEPNVINSLTPNIHILRGPPGIARGNSLPLHAQWNMEFDVSSAPYYKVPMEAAKDLEKNLSLHDLYYWTPSLIIPGTSEEVMLCSVPLIDSDNNVFGVCGFEVRAMLFKLAYAPNKNVYNRTFFMLYMPEDELISTRQSMIAGRYSSKISSGNNETIKIIKGKKSFNSYVLGRENILLGFHCPVKLYPDDSFFSDNQWMAAIMIPKDDIIKSIFRLNLFLSSLIILLLVIGVITSFFLSKRYVKPISEGFDRIKSVESPQGSGIKIPEIDDLIEFLTINNQKLHQKGKDHKMAPTLLEEFTDNTKTLSPAERAVFDLYVQNYTGREIADILSLSINTIKTHNKRIYTKLNVGSREELLLYINMLKDIGQDIQ